MGTWLQFHQLWSKKKHLDWLHHIFLARGPSPFLARTSPFLAALHNRQGRVQNWILTGWIGGLAERGGGDANIKSCYQKLCFMSKGISEFIILITGFAVGLPPPCARPPLRTVRWILSCTGAYRPPVKIWELHLYTYTPIHLYTYTPVHISYTYTYGARRDARLPAADAGAYRACPTGRPSA